MESIFNLSNFHLELYLVREVFAIKLFGDKPLIAFAANRGRRGSSFWATDATCESPIPLQEGFACYGSC